MTKPKDKDKDKTCKGKDLTGGAAG